MDKSLKNIPSDTTIINALNQTLLNDFHPPRFEIASDEKRVIIIIPSENNTVFNKKNINNENNTVNKQKLIFSLVGIIPPIVCATWFLSSQINSSVNESRKEIMALMQNEKTEIVNHISKVEDRILRVEDKTTKIDEKINDEFKETNKNINEIRILLIEKEHKKNKYS